MLAEKSLNSSDTYQAKNLADEFNINPLYLCYAQAKNIDIIITIAFFLRESEEELGLKQKLIQNLIFREKIQTTFEKFYSLY